MFMIKYLLPIIIVATLISYYLVERQPLCQEEFCILKAESAYQLWRDHGKTVLLVQDNITELEMLIISEYLGFDARSIDILLVGTNKAKHLSQALELVRKLKIKEMVLPEIQGRTEPKIWDLLLIESALYNTEIVIIANSQVWDIGENLHFIAIDNNLQPYDHR